MSDDYAYMSHEEAMEESRSWPFDRQGLDLEKMLSFFREKDIPIYLINSTPLEQHHGGAYWWHISVGKDKAAWVAAAKDSAQFGYHEEGRLRALVMLKYYDISRITLEAELKSIKKATITGELDIRYFFTHAQDD